MDLIALLFGGLSFAIMIIGIPCTIFPNSMPTTILQLFYYGKCSNSKQMNYVIRTVQVPKRWFTHFYVFGVCYASIVVIFLSSWVLLGLDPPSPVIQFIEFFSQNQKRLVSNSVLGLVSAILFLVHLARRMYEVLYVNTFSDAKMNLLHYLSGLLHYFGTVTSLLIYTVDIKHQVQGSHLDSGVGLGRCLIIFTAISSFLFASYFQYESNKILANLRRNSNEKEKYFLPIGSLFELISCPHYLCEIIIYLSLYMILGFNHYPWAIATLWVTLNQVLAALMAHTWYHKNFRNYPKQRKAIIPFLL